MSIDARFAVDRGEFFLDVDLALPSLGVTSLFGPSGCGKTTILRAIAGLDRHPGGRLSVGDVTWQAEGRFVPPHRRPVGYVFQEASLFPHLTVLRNLEYGLKRTAPESRQMSAAQAVDLLGIGHLLERRPHTLSGGERQRVAIARALAVSPRLLLMDEPLASLDRAGKEEILPYLESLRDELEIPVIYVSHTPEEVARLADHVVLMEKGRVVATGPINDVFSRLDLPLAIGPDAEVVLDATVVEHDDDFHLTCLDFEGGRLVVPREALATGRRVRVRLAARDVSIAVTRPSGTSILNVFPATVDDMTPAASGQVTVRLRVGTAALLSRITYKSLTVLELTAGKAVYAQIKSVALLS